MTEVPQENSVPSRQEVLTTLKSKSYRLPRYLKLEGAFHSVLDQFLASMKAGRHVEGRGLVLSAESRSGKTHDMTRLLSMFSTAGGELPSGYQRKVVSVSLRSACTWKSLGSECLLQLGYPSGLEQRSADTVWRRAEALMTRQGICIVHVDEAQHLFQTMNEREVKNALNGLKDLIKRPDWPVVLALSGVPDLLEYLNTSDELLMLLEPVFYPDMTYSPETLAEVDAMLVQFASVYDLDVSSLRDDDTYCRIIHACGARWGRACEMVVTTVAAVVSSGRHEMAREDLAETFRRWTNVVPDGNVFLIRNPYAIQTRKLYAT
jgi:hypothetical protein